MKPLWNIYQVAKALNVSTATVRRWFAQGILPQPIRLGGTLRWKPEEIEALLLSDDHSIETAPGESAAEVMAFVDSPRSKVR